jgi:hypothetical protein
LAKFYFWVDQFDGKALSFILEVLFTQLIKERPKFEGSTSSTYSKVFFYPLRQFKTVVTRVWGVPITTDLPLLTPKIGGDRRFGAGGDALAAVVNVQWGKLRCACVGEGFTLLGRCLATRARQKKLIELACGLF